MEISYCISTREPYTIVTIIYPPFNKYKLLVDNPLFIAFRKLLTPNDYIMITLPVIELSLRYPASLELYNWVLHTYRRNFKIAIIDNHPQIFILKLISFDNKIYYIGLYKRDCAVSMAIVRHALNFNNK